MLPMLLLPLTAVCVFSGVTTETVVAVAGRRVTLPCRAGAESQQDVEVCWGRGEPSLFTCHNTVLTTTGGQTTYRKSYRYSSSSSSLSILISRPSDAGFYHCRVQLPGLFNDQTSTVHLIIISRSHAVVSEPTDREDAWTVNSPHTTAGFTTRDVTEQTGSDVTAGSFTEPVVAFVQSAEQQEDTLQIFITNTLRASFIIFIPALLLTAGFRVWRANQRAEPDKRPDQSEEEDSSV
ncbi:T-cell immunoglobulin and mucin domain-containing protein 4-like isoform X2 [Notolabrus celidotus]|uniref:T-cell immunoglobulin and mucin domain-containing protein 4-like isoform X2 n=1 Tax=Notolabrus celidotus TaxID=1203425 RepID=UPI001490734E|nr:T-cell immunoglobulin and mucin domain-containing protein 4-like isoform X2 [Notolabrus celidotus]